MTHWAERLTNNWIIHAQIFMIISFDHIIPQCSSMYKSRIHGQSPWSYDHCNDHMIIAWIMLMNTPNDHDHVRPVHFAIIFFVHHVVLYTESTKPEKEDRNFCRDKTDGFYAHPTCEKFYQCYHSGTTHIGQCQYGLIWNPNLNACDWPSNYNCNEIWNRTTITNTTNQNINDAANITNFGKNVLTR